MSTANWMNILQKFNNMRKILFFAIALVAGALAFTSCDPNNPSNPTGDGNKYEGVWVSDSVIDANGDQYPHGAFWTILNSKEVEIHGWGTSCTWEERPRLHLPRWSGRL